MNRVPTPPTRPAPRTLRALLAAGEWDARPDAELLDRFARYAEQPAFEAILRRHGPLVWGVCRRALPDPADADDAFQSTFLILVRKAESVARGERLGPWLYGVASRVARRVRERAARSPVCDPEAAAMIPDRTPPDPDTDWLPVLDRELSALPAKYRDPLVLCELQGLTRKAAAERLKLREGTLSSRLARGRELLRKRLLKHGTLLPAGGLAVLLGPAEVARGVPVALLSRAVETAAGAVPAAVAKLTDEVLRGMFLTKLKLGGAGALAAVLAAGLALGAAAGPDEKPKASRTTIRPIPPAAEQLAEEAKAAPPAAAADDLALLQGVWVGNGVSAGAWGRCVIQGDVMWMLPFRERYALRREVRLTPDRDPKWIDLTTDGCSPVIADRTPGAVTPCIYSVSDKHWAMAYPRSPGRLRPAAIEPSGWVQPVWFGRKFRPEGDTDPKPEAAGREWVGRWTVTRQAYPHDDHSAMVDRAVGVVEITPDYLFIQRPCDGAGKHFVWEAAEYTLDPAKNPKWVDLKFCGKGPDPDPINGYWAPRKPDPDANGYGVYEQSGDTLRIAYRVGVPRELRTLEFKPGIEEEQQPPEEVGKREVLKPACGLLELKRAP